MSCILGRPDRVNDSENTEEFPLIFLSWLLRSQFFVVPLK